MVVLVFENPGIRCPSRFSRIAAIHIVRDTITCPQNGLVARFAGRRWELKSEEFLVVRIDVAVMLHFESADGEKSAQAAYPALRIVDGVILVPSSDEPVAMLVTPSKLWYSYLSDREWETIIIEATAESPPIDV